MKAERPRILFINHELDRRERTRPIIAALSSKYEFQEKLDLSREAVDLVRSAERCGRPYAAVITHVPPGPRWPEGYAYGRSQDLITAIVWSTEAAVIAYTAATIKEVSWLPRCVDAVVEKGRISEDIPSLRKELARLARRPRRVLAIDPPEIVHRDGCTVTSAAVNLWHGLHEDAIHLFRRLLDGFDGAMTLRKMDDAHEQVILHGGLAPTAKARQDHFFYLAMFAAQQGERIEISVTGTAPASEAFARRVHAFLTARFYWEVSPNASTAPPPQA